MIIDSHIHLTADNYQEDFDQLLEEAQEAGVKAFVCIGAGFGTQTARQTVELAEKYDCIYAVVGIHPCDADQVYDFKEIEELAEHPKVVGIGETGLDFYHAKDFKDKQYPLFLKHTELARN